MRNCSPGIRFCDLRDPENVCRDSECAFVCFQGDACDLSRQACRDRHGVREAVFQRLECDCRALRPAPDLWFVATRRRQSKVNRNELQNSKTTETKCGMGLASNFLEFKESRQSQLHATLFCFAMTVYQDLLSKGYFPKELPPAFFSEQFARYAVSKHGRTTIKSYKPRESFTECVRYRLALAGLNRRELRIPHPASYANLADLTARNFPRLLKKVSGAGFSRSLPTYVSGRQRALHPRIKPADLARERAVARAGSSYLLKADISQFYSSLYTHAVGWAVDPELWSTANWRNRKLLGYKLDRALMDLDGKISQGIPIGNDISFLLAELVLARVDKAMIVDHGFDPTGGSMTMS